MHQERMLCRIDTRTRLELMLYSLTNPLPPGTDKIVEKQNVTSNRDAPEYPDYDHGTKF